MWYLPYQGGSDRTECRVHHRTSTSRNWGGPSLEPCGTPLLSVASHDRRLQNQTILISKTYLQELYLEPYETILSLQWNVLSLKDTPREIQWILFQLNFSKIYVKRFSWMTLILAFVRKCCAVEFISFP